MKKFALGTLFALFPLLALAQDSGALSFAPPPSDYSVVFLGNIFGIVDGVLHGTGSQIMGTMFGVFNAAVLALGGIVIIYTLLVSTMNTAQEGQLLGQKWSSIWVPMRSTLGLALLIPKASGYCLMQIFVMWVVVQGVGAADKVWNAALSYLNRGGVIVQTQINPIASLTASGSGVAKGASTILAGQVCMAGIQMVLENQRQGYLNMKGKGTGPCSGTPSDSMKEFCEKAVPDFINSVNMVQVQNKNLKNSTGNYEATMPYFGLGNSNSPYAQLDGICGKIVWSPLSSYDKDKNVVDEIKSIKELSSSELETAEMSRAIAIQQMYLDLALVAKIMVNNDPEINKSATTTTSSSNTSSSNQSFSKIATQQFGVPYLASGSPCSGPSKSCVSWGSDPSKSSPAVFSGSEFQGAVADYNGIMAPTLNLIRQAEQGKSASEQRQFIQKAQTQGWLMAGSYFFDLARLSSASLQDADKTDKNSGLDQSQFTTDSIVKAFGSNNKCKDPYKYLCDWMQTDQSPLNSVVGLINGASILSTPLSPPDVTSLDHKAVKGLGSSTVYGFVDNSLLVNLPGQPGVNPPQFAMKFNFDINPGTLYLKSQDFPCGKVKIVFWSFCLGSLLGDIFYNLILRNLFNFFLNMMATIVNTVVIAFLSLPLLGMADIFRTGVSFIQQPDVNPVIALANMGVNYINFASDLWIYLTVLSITTILIPWFGIFIGPLLAMVMPLLAAWLATMVSIGFVTAYYIPMLPYMIFTFGTIAWLIAVIEAMVAAPIVALGVTHPEGHEAFGKGEQAIMILLNVFLRPAMMIIGYISGIALSYVSVWVINAGFSNAISFIQGDPNAPTWNIESSSSKESWEKYGKSAAAGAPTGSSLGGKSDYSSPAYIGPDFSDQSGGKNYSPDEYSVGGDRAGRINTEIGYSSWAGIYGFFFAILIYTTMYLTAVQKAFTLITYLPDKVLRWIGGGESLGQEAAGWAQEGKQQIEGAGKATSQAGAARDQKLQGMAESGAKKLKGGGKGGEASAKGGKTPEATPSSPTAGE
ncbi:type IVB secretion system protein DotA [Legionella spiritensis]|uniref:type IVB secretion system protein DotA n=1 Tax=Legionella spiritensis TaxID=452 RepID=UPI000F6B83A9|nr:type IVB secretion system protein DotA [Legionella spiritensis]VEG91047.1 defect in organelle trafficking protein DotA [Legionella spiritensis]